MTTAFVGVMAQGAAYYVSSGRAQEALECDGFGLLSVLVAAMPQRRRSVGASYLLGGGVSEVICA